MLESVSIDLLKKKKRIFIATSIYDDWGGVSRPKIRTGGNSAKRPKFT